MLDDHQVIVPNSRLGDSILVNYNLPSRRMWTRIDVGVHYGSDLGQVEDAVLDVARAVATDIPAACADEEPLVRFMAFGDSSIDLRVFIMIDEFGEQWRVRHEFIKRLHERFAQEGIVIPFPIRTLHVPEPLPLGERAIEGGPET